MSKSVRVGPWPLGVDNVHFDTDEVFQQGRRKPTQRLLVGDNIDLQDDGWPLLRRPTQEVYSVTVGRAVFSGNDLLLTHQDGAIHLVDLDGKTSTPIVTGLSDDSPVHFVALADRIYWLNKYATGCILDDGTATDWGLAVPNAPAITPRPGSLCPGEYMVAVAYVDALGREHSLSPAASLRVGLSECSGKGVDSGLTIEMSYIHPEAVKVRLYMSEANGSEVYYVTDVDPADFPIAVTNGGSSPWSAVEPIGLFMHPPLPGDGLFEYRGAVVTYTGNMLFQSLGPLHHLFEIGTVAEARPTPVLAGAGLKDGFWTVTKHGAYWTTGDQPSKWDTSPRDGRAYAAGAFKCHGRFLPDAEDLENEVALFVASEGLVAAKNNGTLVPLTQDRHHFDVKGKTATFMLVEQRGIRQVAFTLN